ncbi:MAG: hypothetical protein MJY73_01945 [Bacteroidales bacterium]|nr:hypothetical protein [Bacteroidales bacterium]
MKKRLLIFTFVFVILSAFDATAGNPYERGYCGWVEASGAVNISDNVIDNSFGLLVVNGMNLGEGAFVGGCLGFGIRPYESFALPLLGEMKYSFLDKKTTPFVSIRVGAEIIGEQQELVGGAFVFSPGVGLEMGRFSARIGYNLEAGAVSSPSIVPEQGYVNAHIRNSSFYFGIGWRFF